MTTITGKLELDTEGSYWLWEGDIPIAVRFSSREAAHAVRLNKRITLALSDEPDGDGRYLVSLP